MTFCKNKNKRKIKRGKHTIKKTTLISMAKTKCK